MVCLGLEVGVAGWKVQMNTLSYGGHPSETKFFMMLFWHGTLCYIIRSKSSKLLTILSFLLKFDIDIKGVPR